MQSILLRRVAADWEDSRGQRPLLVESIVGRERLDGASDRAANWIEFGVTRGRGRLEARHERRVAVKRVFVRPLDRRFQDTRRRAGAGAADARGGASRSGCSM
ncbi:MAG: DUF4338 domain-containing protein [Planctomycetes bacterium]|nr:DUF4338 domain-containing protein [Planctomycetota bacterium]